MRTGLLALPLIVSAATADAQRYFHASSGTVDFSKASFADEFNDPSSRDVITDSVALTRSEFRGIYNTPIEDFHESNSPVGTLWFFGATVQDVIDGTIGLGDFDNWSNAHGANPPSTLNIPGVLYLVDDDAYVDITFTLWANGRNDPGGAFAYTRAVVNLVPEPATAALVGVSALGLAARRRGR